MTLRDGIVNHLAIIGTVSGHRADRAVYLIEQTGDHRDIADVIHGQFDGDNFMGIGVDGEVEFPPPAARSDAVLLIEPFAFAVDLDAGAVDQDMQRLVAHDPLWQNGQTATSTAECRVIGNSDPNAEQVRDRAQRTLGLAPYIASPVVLLFGKETVGQLEVVAHTAVPVSSLSG